MTSLVPVTPSAADVEVFARSTDLQTVRWKIEPHVAQYIIENKNVGNRDKRGKNQTDMKTAMQTGNWRMTGESIKFGTDGLLKDGQNRCMACVRAGVPFETLVVAGLDPAVFDAMDTGIRRDAKDIFKLAGIRNYQDTAGAAKWHRWIVGADPVRDRSSVTPQELLAHFRTWCPTMPDSVAAVRNCAKVQRQPIALLAALHHEFRRNHPVDADRFFEDWAATTQGPKARSRDPIPLLWFALAERTRNLATVGGRIHDRDRMLMIVLCWNAYCRGKSVPKREDVIDVNVKGAGNAASSLWPGIR